MSNDTDMWVGEKVKISLKSGMYYKGLILSVGEDFLKMRDFKDTIVFIRVEHINVIEGWKG